MSEARNCFGGSKDYQLSTEAIAALALHLDGAGKAIAEQVLQAVEQENEHRQRQGLPPRRRIFANDVQRAIKDLTAVAEGTGR